MYKLKIIIPTIVFLVLLIFTSTIKNKTRIIEKKLHTLNKKINFKEQDINESQLEFYFLTSPEEVEKKIKELGYDKYSPIKNSKIFSNLSNFTDIQKKILTFNYQYEKKIQKN